MTKSPITTIKDITEEIEADFQTFELSDCYAVSAHMLSGLGSILACLYFTRSGSPIFTYLSIHDFDGESSIQRKYDLQDLSQHLTPEQYQAALETIKIAGAPLIREYRNAQEDDEDQERESEKGCPHHYPDF